MPKLLHILTESNDALAQKIVARQKENPENKIEVVDLTQPDPDYKAVVEKIFAADSVEIW